jgi:hypothetical protein
VGSESSDGRLFMTFATQYSLARDPAFDNAVFDLLIDFLPCFAKPTPTTAQALIGGRLKRRWLTSSSTSASHFCPL